MLKNQKSHASDTVPPGSIPIPSYVLARIHKYYVCLKNWHGSIKYYGLFVRKTSTDP
jgi:hypothetical protein